MHKEGHIGIGLILFSPFIFLFTFLNMISVGLVFGVLFIFLSFHPDIDMKIQRKTSFLRNDFIKNIIPYLEKFLDFTKHRGVTHTVWYAILWGAIVSIVGLTLSESLTEMITLGIIGFLIGFIGIVSHLVGDVLTPMGIEPFYPIKKTNYSLEKINASNKLYNYIFLFIGSVFSLISFYIARFFANFV